MGKKTTHTDKEEKAPSQNAPEAADVQVQEEGDPQAQKDSEEQAENGEPDWEVRISELQQELEQTNNRLLRQAAELQNFRRRAEEEKIRLVASSKTRVLRPMLEVLDDLERSLEAAEALDVEADADKAYASLKEGVEMVLRKFQTALEQQGVEPIEAEGEPFDEHEHEAMMQQPAPDDAEPGMVLQEIQKGYRMGERVLRHSKVVVAADE